MGRILGSGEKGYRGILYGVAFTFIIAESEANCDAGVGPVDRPGRGAGGKGCTAAEPGG